MRRGERSSHPAAPAIEHGRDVPFLQRTVARRSAVRHGERLQQRPHRGRGDLAQTHRRHVRHHRRRLTQPQSFVRAEEERPIPDDGTAEHAAELMMPELRLLQVRRVGEPVVRVERVVARSIERDAVELVRARRGSSSAICAPGVRPNSAAYEDVWMRTLSSASTPIRLFVVPSRDAAGTPPPAAGSVDGPALTFALAPSIVR